MSPLVADALVFGCGYLGRRVAARWLAAGHRVAALTRQNASNLASLGVQPVVGDILDPGSLRDLPDARTVLYAVGMDRTQGKTMQAVYVDGLGHVLDALPRPARLIYVSSTGVYGQTNGSWVDGLSATEPREESGLVVLEAERLLRARYPDAIILRFAGIYGPDRLLRKNPILRGEPLVGNADHWLNLIHVDDGADIVLEAESKAVPGATYTVADDEPVPRRSFYALLAKLLNAPPAQFVDRPEPIAANRRVSNRAVREQLAWSPRFPTYREGLPAAVRESS